MRLVSVIVIPAALAAALTVAPIAAADCTSAAGTTVCGQGDVRGADTGKGPGSTVASVPYCWWCYNNGGLTFVIAPRARGGR
jgi:uncharacterized membrane protein